MVQDNNDFLKKREDARKALQKAFEEGIDIGLFKKQIIDRNQVYVLRSDAEEDLPEIKKAKKQAFDNFLKVYNDNAADAGVLEEMKQGKGGIPYFDRTFIYSLCSNQLNVPFDIQVKNFIEETAMNYFAKDANIRVVSIGSEMGDTHTFRAVITDPSGNMGIAFQDFEKKLQKIFGRQPMLPGFPTHNSLTIELTGNAESLLNSIADHSQKQNGRYL